MPAAELAVELVLGDGDAVERDQQDERDRAQPPARPERERRCES